MTSHRLQLIDYRAVTGQFDRIVCLGMFEHVSLRHYQNFFNTLERLLKPDGIALCHAIARADGSGRTDP